MAGGPAKHRSKTEGLWPIAIAINLQGGYAQ